MDPATALLIGGTALNIFGQWQANLAQAQAERENAAWLEEQAAFIDQSTRRSADIYERQAAQFTEQQLGEIGATGFELSGSMSDLYDDTLRSIDEEIEAIYMQGYMQKKEAELKAFQANRQATRLSSFSYNALQAAGPALTSMGTYYGRKG